MYFRVGSQPERQFILEPQLILVSAGFDAHRADPLTGLGLSAGDFADLTLDLLQLVPAGKQLAFLEGGYDLEALADCTAACLVALAGERHAPERPTAGGPGGAVPEAAALVHRKAVDSRIA